MSVSAEQRPGPDAEAAARPIRVSIVDDAVVVRGLLSRWFGEAGGIEVVSTHRTGVEAVAAVERVRPDVMLLDIEMPDMDGLTALPLLLARHPGLLVVVASTLTTRNAQVSLRCLSLGAVDYIAKPSTNRDVTFSADFRREIVDKVRALGARALLRSPRFPHAPRQPLSTPTGSAAGRTPSAAGGRGAVPPIALRPFSRAPARVLAIGASTGGPSAVGELLRRCGPVLQRLPVLVVQHMPAMFTTMFAEHLRRQLGLDAFEAREGEPVLPGRVYVAPGGRHLRFARDRTGVTAVVDDAPPVNFCRPSVDVTFAAAAEQWGAGTLAVTLTGMGSDGLVGAEAVVAAGGNVLAQDERSSVVWGMPGVVAKRGLCAAVEPIEGLARIVGAARGTAP